MQSLLSRERFQPFEHVDTGENSLIKGVLGQAVEVPLVQISIVFDQVDSTILGGLIDELPADIDVLIGNDNPDVAPIHVGVATRSNTRKPNTNAAVTSRPPEEDVVSDKEANIQMVHDTNATHSIATDQLKAVAQDPLIASLLINDDVRLDLDQELPNLFNEQAAVDIVAGHSIVSRTKLIDLLRKDTSLQRYFDLVNSPDPKDVHF